ncbi:MAG: response regulator transcription factor [Armatimonadaceae bacterium]
MSQNDTASGIRPGPIRVLLADDHEMVREGLALILAEENGDGEPGIALVGQAADGEEALRLARELRPDVLLMDLVMPRRDGVEVTEILTEEGSPARVLILTSFVDAERIRAAIRAGATGYLLKDMRRADIIRAIRAAADGEPTLHPTAQSHLMRQVTQPAETSLLNTLTGRETDVLRLVATGHSNKEIANTLSLSIGTVKGYVSSILVKLEVADRTQATLYAIKHGLVAEVTLPEKR